MSMCVLSSGFIFLSPFFIRLSLLVVSVLVVALVVVVVVVVVV